MKRRVSAGLAAAVIFFACTCTGRTTSTGTGPSDPQEPASLFPCLEAVSTRAGLVQGGLDPEGLTCSWKGVPFAAAPVGPLRWRAPQPVPPWPGVRGATSWGNDCVQRKLLQKLHLSPAGMSEDCLFLNIWRPREAGRFPVMVWIHGGAYLCGTGAAPMYHGDRLSASGRVVLVTINYRLGPLGFLAHEALAREDPHGSTGNYGTLDQIAALQWVQENISAFGGDPDNVTIFGQSAGGWSICTLLATPLARGLFHRAILQSGACEMSCTMEQGYAVGRWAAGKLGCEPDDLDCLRSRRARDIERKVSPDLSDFRKGDRYIFTYINHEDGHVLSGSPLSMIREGRFNNVPLMAGSTRDEFQPMSLLPAGKLFMSGRAYRKQILREYGPEAAAVLELYPAAAYGRPSRAYTAILADRMLVCPTDEAVRTVATRQPAAYYYRFDYDGTRLGGTLGAAHVMEIPLLFAGYDRKPFRPAYRRRDRDKLEGLSRILQGYWVNFAYTGDPNGPGLPLWPAYREPSPKIQVLDEEVRTLPPDTAERCRYWREQHPRIPPLPPACAE